MKAVKTGDIMFDLSVKFMGKPLSKALGDELTRISSNVIRNMMKEATETLINSVPLIVYYGVKPVLQEAVQ